MLCYISTCDLGKHHQYHKTQQSIQTFLQQQSTKLKNQIKMFKLVVLSALLAVAAARPSLEESHIVYSAPSVAVQEHAYANVGHIVKSIPTSVSHQSSSVVHSSDHVVEDILAPAVKTTHYAAPAPLVHQTYAAVHAPLYKSYAASAPVYKTYAASPYVQSAHVASPYAAYSPYSSYAGVAPLSYVATGAW